MERRKYKKDAKLIKVDNGKTIKTQNKEPNNKKRKSLDNNDMEEKKAIASTSQNESENYDLITQLPLNVIEESKQLAQVLGLQTIRKKKKGKHKKLVEDKANLSASREVQRNEEYLRMWKNSREKWKFEKLRQISIEQTMLHQLSEELWPIALEYLAGSQGAAKERILALANNVIDQMDKEYEKLSEGEIGKTDLIENSIYQRARDLLQTFN